MDHCNSKQCPLSAPSPPSVMSDSDQRAYIDTAAREATRAQTEKPESDSDPIALRDWMANGADARLVAGSSFLRAAGGKSSEYKEIEGPRSTQRKLEYRMQWSSITNEKLMRKNYQESYQEVDITKKRILKIRQLASQVRPVGQSGEGNDQCEVLVLALHRDEGKMAHT